MFARDPSTGTTTTTITTKIHNIDCGKRFNMTTKNSLLAVLALAAAAGEVAAANGRTTSYLERELRAKMPKSPTAAPTTPSPTPAPAPRCPGAPTNAPSIAPLASKAFGRQFTNFGKGSKATAVPTAAPTDWRRRSGR